ncbi:hypothetical protein TTHERM_00188640 (macronuclear) [Tetrahymena thermophila SB210]|uniref:Uncharacterized protein n=1 Tax=Tetrahymena thermophila (strain SB210) TaxID=312017 RepID=I7MEG2_TETTS|nr:hypothetical protein TTHERM_00188640 [Tetrahymena thermophila SB210]EAR96295.2 hypothetical protein TTHERM_00188640 [Tetrahymena thermophila SB210]|eukprot:XP_001016540.2 hypothetical protein TTHERM_00188640 [Tetrahymena thermophila SB210]
MKVRKSIQEENQIISSVESKLSQNEDNKTYQKKSDLQSYFSDKDIQLSSQNFSQNLTSNNKLNPISSLLFDQSGNRLKQNLLPFTDREARLPQYGSQKNYTKESDEIDEGPNFGSSGVTVKKSAQTSATKTVLSFQKKSPVQSQISSYSHIQAGDAQQLNSDNENTKSLNNLMPNYQIQEQYYSVKMPSSQQNSQQIKQQSFQQFKNFNSDMNHNNVKAIKSYSNLLQSPDILERKSNPQFQSQQKFFHIKHLSQDPGFFQSYSQVKLSAQNLDGNNHTVPISNQIKKRQDYRSLNDKKEEKLNILVILNQINALYEKDGKISYNLCILVQKLIGKLSKQDNMYGDQMKLFFNIIQQMIICEEETILNRIKQSKSLKKKKQTISSIPAYFQCVQILSEEIDYLNTHFEQIIQQIKEEKEKVIEENFSLRDKIQVAQTDFVKNSQSIEKNYQNKLNESRKKIEQQISQQEEYIKELNGLKEQIRLTKQENEKQMRNNNNLNYMLQQSQQKINELNDIINCHLNEIQQKEQKIINCNQQFEQYQNQLGQFTPRPKFDGFFNMFEQVSDFSISFALDQKGLSTQDKIDYIQYMVQEKIINSQTIKDEDKKKSQAKIKQQSKIKQKPQISKENQNTPPKSRNPNRKTSNFKYSNSINISSNSSSQVNIKNLKDIFIKAVQEVQKRLRLKKLQMKQGVPGSDQLDIFSLNTSQNLNSLSSSQLNNKFEQKLSNFSKSMRSIPRKASNGLSLQRSNSRATLQSMDSLDILGKENKLKKSENLSQPNIFDQVSNIAFEEVQFSQSNFKRSNKGRSSTIIQKKKTTIIEEHK